MDLEFQDYTVKQFGENMSLKISWGNIADAAFIMFFSFGVFSASISKLLSFIGIGGTTIALVLLMMVVSLALLYSVRFGLTDCLILYLGILMLFLISIPINPGVIKWYLNPNWGVAYRVFRPDRAIFAYLIIRLVSQKKVVERDLLIVGYINALYIMYQGLGRISLGYWEVKANDGITMLQTPYNMAYGYNAAFVSIIMFALINKNNKKWNLTIGLITAILSIIFGSRGSLIIFAAFIGIQFFLIIKEARSKLSIFVFLLGVLVLCVVYFQYSSIITFITGMASRYGIASRNLEKLQSVSSLTASSSRDMIAELSVQGIKESFPFGKGAYGDRTSVGTVYAWGYSHNIVLEMISSFGVLGIVILLGLIIITIKIIFGSTDKTWRNIYIVFFCNSLKLLVSDSFWFLPYFWAMLAVIRCLKRDKMTLQLKKLYKE